MLSFLVFASANFAAAQESFTFEVNRVFPHISISTENLNNAKTIADLNKFYKPSWVKEYISVEISAPHNGEQVKAVSKNDVLSQKQKEIMKHADLGEDIYVLVKYIPDNNLKHNDPKEHDFTFSVDPDSEASFPEGQEQLTKYLKEKAIDKISSTSFEGYDLTAIEFTISEEGEVRNAQVFNSAYQTYKNEEVNQLLLKTVQAMPCWKPAEYANGTKVEQKFVLTVGNMNNCIIPLLGIKSEKLSSQ